jgi:multicomponent Na+:H+ antiporter subunit D
MPVSMPTPMSATDALIALVFLPLAAATLAAALPAVAGRALALLSVLAMPLLLWRLTSVVMSDGHIDVALAGLLPPLGIRLHLDGLSLLLLWLVAVVLLAATVHAAASIGAARRSRSFWAAWLTLQTGLHAMLLSADLFNLYVGLELTTLGAVALVAWAGSTDALRAALRYLLLAMLGSLAYLLGVALVFAATGTLDLALAIERSDGLLPAAALALMTAGLLLKSAVFPLHGWLPQAHASAPGPVSAVLSALVVKASLYLVYRLWLDPVALPSAEAGMLLAWLGAGAVLYGSLLALRQQQLKRLIAYSTVAQLGYLLLLFAMPSVDAWHGTLLQLGSHGLAKAAMFLAAANLIQRLGSGDLARLAGADARLPISVFAFALASVSLMGLPPSGGFLAKWLLLGAAWQHDQWGLIVVLLLGSLLAAGYLFRVLALMMARPVFVDEAVPGSAPPRIAEYVALALAVGAIVLGFVALPLLAVLPLPAVIGGGA